MTFAIFDVFNNFILSTERRRPNIISDWNFEFGKNIILQVVNIQKTALSMHKVL